MGRTSSETAAVVDVEIPSPLRSYTGGDARVKVAVPLLAPESPPTLGGVLAALDGGYHGIRFRIVDEQGRVRPHIRIFVGQAIARDLRAPVPAGNVVMIVAALSGG
ncbi:MAG: MoaD/ThiS family protein [Casimicrobiaceae bacterium]